MPPIAALCMQATIFAWQKGFAVRQEAFMQPSFQKGGMKNLGGRLILNMAIPGYQKIIKTYWDIEDLRLALLGRLKPAA